jgi:hypothetical protein
VSWILFTQLLILMVTAAIILTSTLHSIIDKRREDAIKRKEAGL